MSSLIENALRQLQLADSPFHCIFFLVLTAVEVNPAFTLIEHSVRSELLCSNSTEVTDIIPELYHSECKEDQFTTIFFPWPGINTRKVFAELSSAVFKQSQFEMDFW